jgi:hypothetical protein
MIIEHIIDQFLGSLNLFIEKLPTKIAFRQSFRPSLPVNNPYAIVFFDSMYFDGLILILVSNRIIDR